jgi:hypothetical protein
VGFLVDKVALGQVYLRVLWFSSVSFIPPVLHYLQKRKKKIIIFVTEWHNKPQECGASVASAARLFTIKIRRTKLSGVREAQALGVSVDDGTVNNMRQSS